MINTQVLALLKVLWLFFLTLTDVPIPLPFETDPNFVTCFLLTYRSFLTPLELMELLTLRFDTPPPKEGDVELFTRSTQVHIRLRYWAPTHS